MRTGHSQNDEEAVILKYFKTTTPACFLDIGAHDGVTFSNTRALAELGWTGTLVEPSPAAFQSLMNTYKDRPEMNLVNAAMVPTAAKVIRFYDSGGDMISTVDEKHRALWATNPKVNYRAIHVAGISVDMLLAALPGPYTFVNLDVEGINYELFAQLPLCELAVQLVCVEYQDKLAAVEARAVQQGYQRLHLTGENVIYARR